MMHKTHHNRRRGQSGNIFFMLFASVALVGAFGVGASNVMKGLVASMSDVTRKTIAEEKMTAGARLAIQNATATQGTGGDCDGDSLTGIDLLVEPLPFRNAGAATHPVGGGYLPLEIGATLSDPWGTQFGYCAWDPGTIRDAAGCGGPGANRRIGMGINIEATAGLVVAVISAGKDRRFTTTCNDFVDTTPADGSPDVPLIQRGAGGDDIVFEYNYSDANGLSGDDLWRVKDTAPDTAQIDKDVEIAGDASMEGVLELRERGLLLPDETETGLCTALNESELRVNSSASPSILEICYDTVWEPISMGSDDAGGGGVSGACTFGTWADNTATAAGVSSNDVFYANGLFISTGLYGTVKTSPDGITWTSRTGIAGNWNSGAYGAGLYVAVGDNYVMTSPDGITWTARTTPEDNNWESVIYANGRFVAVSNNGTNRAMRSTDGITWTVHSTPTGAWGGIVYNNGLYTATAGSGTSRVMTSPDGATWTDVPVTSPVPRSGLAYGRGLYVTVQNNVIATSPDRVVWTETVAPTGVTGLEKITYGGGRFVAVGWSGSPRVITSEDGLNWTPITPPLVSNFTRSAFGADRWVIVSPNADVVGAPCTGYVAPPEPEIIVPDPIIHLKLEEQTGTNVVDTMNRVTSTLTGAATPPTTMGQIGRAYDLDGTDDRVVITSNPALNNLTAFTISFWIYGINSGSAQYLTDNRDVGSNGIRLLRHDVSHAFTAVMGVGGSFTTNETIPNNAWTHVAFAYDSSNLTVPPTIYINGVAATYASSTLPSSFTQPGGNWTIGATQTGALANPGRFDDYRVFGQVLSAEQIALLYNDRTSTTYIAPNPIAIMAASKYRGKITANENMACGIKEDGSTWCWGDEANGSMGDGAATPGGAGYVSPVRVDMDTLQNSFLQVSMGLDFSCSIKSDRTAWCWGTDALGQLGNAGSIGTQHVPTQVAGGGLWTQISAGLGHACGIQSNGDLYCWGDAGSGQLGTSTGPNTSPVIITEPGPWVYVAAGSYQTCGIKADGSAWCWGDQNHGRLGNGLTASVAVSEATPVLEPGPWVKLSRGGGHTCGIKLDGSAWCWGQALRGKLGNGTTSPNTGMPQRVLDAGPWIDIESSLTDDTTCGIKYDGTMWCWGTDTSQQLGNGSGSSVQTSPSRVLDPGPWAAVTMGLNLTCGMKADGSAWCWGSDTDGRLGNGALITGTQDIPTRVENFPNVAPFAFNSAQTILTRNSAATTISLGGTNRLGGLISYDGYSGGFGFMGSGRSMLFNPNGNSGLSIESRGGFDSQISWKTVTGATTRSIGVDNVTGNLEFGNNIAAVTTFMSGITPHMVINNSGQWGVGTAVPGARLGITGGGLRVGDDTRACTLSRKGTLRFNTGTMQYCNGVAWVNF